MGNLRLAMREDISAESHYKKSYELVQNLGTNLQVEAWNYYHMAALDFFRGKWESSMLGFYEALKCFTRLKDDLGKVAALVHLGEINCNQKKLDDAEVYLQKAVQLLLTTECKPLLADALTGVAQLLKARRDERKAVGLLMVALSHPTCRQQTKDRMVALAMELQSSFSAEEAHEGFEWAKGVSLKAMAESWATPKSKGRKR
jgi:tetratricopeptide (TPR) repeat protein